MSISKDSKLDDKSQYDSVFAARNTINSKYFKMFWQSNENGCSRLGVSVAKRNVKKAVARNKLKRITKESFRLKQDLLPAVDIVVIVKNSANLVPRAILWDELNRKWNHFAILEKKQGNDSCA